MRFEERVEFKRIIEDIGKVWVIRFFSFKERYFRVVRCKLKEGLVSIVVFFFILECRCIRIESCIFLIRIMEESLCKEVEGGS